MLNDINGSFIIAQTPFNDRGAVDLASIDTLVDFYLDHGADGFVVLGVSGEGGKLTPDEAVSVATRFIARAGRKPVIVGVSNPGLAQLRLLSVQAMDQGASGVMIAPPSGLKTEEELLVTSSMCSHRSATCRRCCRIFRSRPVCGCRCRPSCT
jgi:4-hydroxy-tetrahydrodipicolinate synthase